MGSAITRRRGRALATASLGREFRALWFAEAVSLVGDQLTRVAISILVFDRTDSAALTALTYAMTYLPDAIAGPLLSGLADRLPRRDVLAVCSVAQACIIAAVALPGIPIWVVAALVAASAFVQAPFRAAQSASVRDVAGDDDQRYSDANSSITLMREAGQLAGLAVAGIAVTALGVTTALLVDAASFVAAAVLILFGLHRREAARPRVGRREPLAPDPRRRPLVTFTLLCALTILPFGLVVPLVTELGAPLWTTGLLLAADPAGIVIAGILVRRWMSFATQQKWLGTLALVSLAAMIPMALARHWMLAAALLFISGAGAIYTLTAKVALLSTMPNDQTGYVAGMVRTGLRVSQGSVLLIGGWIADLTGSAAQTIAGAGVIGVIGCVLNDMSWRRSHRRAEPAGAAA